MSTQIFECWALMAYSTVLIIMTYYSFTYTHIHIYICTIVWKIFVWNYLIVENIRENKFHGLPIPQKYFNNSYNSLIAIIILTIILSFFITNKSGREW